MTLHQYIRHLEVVIAGERDLARLGQLRAYQRYVEQALEEEASLHAMELAV